MYMYIRGIVSYKGEKIGAVVQNILRLTSSYTLGSRANSK